MERIESLDTLKGLALLAVVLTHMRGFFIGERFSASTLDFIAMNSAIFGVPLFFLIAGYLFRKKLIEKRNPGDYALSYVKKIGYYYILGSLIYAVLQTAVAILSAKLGFTLINGISLTTISQINSPVKFMYNFFYTGYAIRELLWFLPALIISTSLIFISKKYGKFNSLLASSFGIHIIAILSNSYQLLDFPIPPKDALFFGLIYTCIGFKVAEINRETFYKHRTKILGLTGLFLILNLAERFMINQLVDISPFFWIDYSFMTLPFTVSILILGISRPDLGNENRLSTYGKYTLWAYILHQIFGAILVGITLGADKIIGISLLESSIWNLILVIGTFILTFETVILYENLVRR